MFQAAGCQGCDDSGYSGRVGLHEFFTLNTAVRHLIQIRATSDELMGQALATGMRSLRQDGIEKVLQGFTDIHEVRKVTIMDHTESASMKDEAVADMDSVSA